MPVPGVTTGDTITEAWGDSVASAVTALEASAATAYQPGGTDVAIADGGTGSSNAVAARAALGLGPTNAPALAGVAFPAADVPNANVNTLDDYEEGTFTPVLAFATPGTSSWAPTLQAGFYTKIGNRVFFHWIYSGVPTNGSAAGNLQLTGLPFVASSTANSHGRFGCGLSGFTKAGYTQVIANVIPGGSLMQFLAYGSGVAASTIALGDIPSLGTVQASGGGSYIV